MNHWWSARLGGSELVVDAAAGDWIGHLFVFLHVSVSGDSGCVPRCVPVVLRSGLVAKAAAFLGVGKVGHGADDRLASGTWPGDHLDRPHHVLFGGVSVVVARQFWRGILEKSMVAAAAQADGERSAGSSVGNPLCCLDRKSVV